MQHLFVSQGLAELIPELISLEMPEGLNTLTWYGHLIPTVGGDFLVLMEATTRFSLLFNWQELQKEIVNAKSISKILENHLQKTVIELTRVSPKTAKRVAISVADWCKITYISVGFDYTVSADLFDIACQLQLMVEEFANAREQIPPEAELVNGLNSVSRSNGDGLQVVPAEAFNRFCCKQLGLSTVAGV